MEDTGRDRADRALQEGDQQRDVRHDGSVYRERRKTVNGLKPFYIIGAVVVKDIEAVVGNPVKVIKRNLDQWGSITCAGRKVYGHCPIVHRMEGSAA